MTKYSVARRQRPEIQSTMDTSVNSASAQAMSVVSRTRNLDVKSKMPSYEGHIGGAPRAMTKVERSMAKEFPLHSLHSGAEALATAAVPACGRSRPWIPT